MSTSDLQSSRTPSTRALIGARDEILKAWTAATRKEIPVAANLSQPILIDTVPVFLQNLAEALAEDHPRVLVTENSNVSEEHGGERARLSPYGPDQLLHEYQILREIIIRILGEKITLTNQDFRVISASVDRAVRESMAAFFLIHNHIRDQFVASLTHDLRQPLGTVKMAADLILDLPNGGEAKPFAHKIVKSIRRADRMIQDLLDATSIQFGHRLPLRLAPGEVVEIMTDLVSDIDQKSARRLRIEGVPHRVVWDAEAIRRAVLNLIINAFKYGKPDGSVSVKIEAFEGRVVIAVHNEGPAIPLIDRELLFEPFRRSEKAKQSGNLGWGIGLALVRAVAESHGGSIGVDSSDETGTTFSLDLPADATPFQGAPTSV